MRQNQFNAVHLALALLSVIVIVAIILPMFGSPRRPAHRMQNSTQLRGIHQGLVTYANSNNEYFPGLSKSGEDDRIAVEQRFQILLEDDYITPEYAMSPSETEPLMVWDGWDQIDDIEPVTPDHYSYAMLQIPKEGGRRFEWSQTLNSQAIVMSARNTGTKANPTSVHSGPGATAWGGEVLWNDNHVGFEMSDTFETKYGAGTLNATDRLFEADSPFDALLIHTGN